MPPCGVSLIRHRSMPRLSLRGVMIAAYITNVIGFRHSIRKTRQRASLNSTMPGRRFGLRAAKKEVSAQWKDVEDALAGYSILGFTVGDSRGRSYEYSNTGGLDRVRPGMSLGKWPVAAAIAGAVQAGKLSFDTLASDVLPWWTKDPKDKRSRVTLRHLLTFTSGFGATSADPLHAAGHNPITVSCLTLSFPTPSIIPLETCARQIYMVVGAFGRIDEPGTLWSYNSYHYQLALALAAKATGLGGREFLKKYLLKPYGMRATWFTGGWNPFVSGGIMSNANDMDKFIRGVLAHKVLNRTTASVLEREVVHHNKLGQKVGFATMGTNTAYEWAMGHVVSKIFSEPPGSPFGSTQFSRPISWWRGASGWGLYMDRKANVYVSCLLSGGYAFLKGKPDPMNVVLKKAYAALGKKFPGMGLKPKA